MLKQIFISEPILSYALIGLGAVIALYGLVKTMQTIGLEKIRKFVYRCFITAEHHFKYGENDKKFEFVVSAAKDAIPAPFNLFITETLLRDVIQLWFDLCKDLLDDGKLNNSEPKEEEETKGDVM